LQGAFDLGRAPEQVLGEAAEAAIGGQRDADRSQQGVERRLATAVGGLGDEYLDLGTVAVEFGARVERHVRRARIAVAQDDEAAGRHA
jgi:hypothetical protein